LTSLLSWTSRSIWFSSARAGLERVRIVADDLGQRSTRWVRVVPLLHQFDVVVAELRAWDPFHLDVPLALGLLDIVLQGLERGGMSSRFSNTRTGMVDLRVCHAAGTPWTTDKAIYPPDGLDQQGVSTVFDAATSIFSVEWAWQLDASESATIPG
jgi:hypothetical protein